MIQRTAIHRTIPAARAEMQSPGYAFPVTVVMVVFGLMAGAVAAAIVPDILKAVVAAVVRAVIGV